MWSRCVSCTAQACQHSSSAICWTMRFWLSGTMFSRRLYNLVSLPWFPILRCCPTHLGGWSCANDLLKCCRKSTICSKAWLRCAISYVMPPVIKCIAPDLELFMGGSTAKLSNAEGMPIAGSSNLDAEAACSPSLAHVLLSIVGSRLHWLHQQLLELHYTCLKPDVDEAEVMTGLQPACFFSAQPPCMLARSQDIV